MLEAGPVGNDPGVVRVRLDIAYDGTGFSGWARQRGLRTVQGELEERLATLFASIGAAPHVTVAGRTDVGVHATGQVAHVDLGPAELAVLSRVRGRATSSGPESLARRLTGMGGPVSDLVVRRSAVAPAGFDARFAALWRRYEYRIADAAASLLGLHDFAAFCRPREGATTIRTLQEFSWRRDAEGVLVAEVRADAFCHSMVRALVGACIAAGERRLATGETAALRDAGVRTSAFKVVPARGLTLIEVGYPPDDELAARVERTRARRDAAEVQVGD